jgi:hypothetical protein
MLVVRPRLRPTLVVAVEARGAFRAGQGAGQTGGKWVETKVAALMGEDNCANRFGIA